MVPQMLPYASQLAAERAMLKGRKEGVELSKMGAVPGLELVDLGDAGGKGFLSIEGRQWKRNIYHPPQAEIAVYNTFGKPLGLLVAI